MDGSLPLQDALVLERRQLDAREPFRRQRRPEERMRVMGMMMDFVKPTEMLLFLRRAVQTGAQVVIANQNSHSLHLGRRDAELRAFLDSADIVQVDSMPVILWSRLLGRRARRFHRSTYLDWRDGFWKLAQAEGWKVTYLGGEPGVAEKAARRIRIAYPGVSLQVRHGYFDATPGSAENEAVLDMVNVYSPDVLLVGMGMPRQELWLARNRHRLDARALLPVGAAFDYEAGVQSEAPRWMGEAGIEWAYRLAKDPRRLFARYCIEPWFLIGALAADLLARLGELRPPPGARTEDGEGSPSDPWRTRREALDS